MICQPTRTPSVSQRQSHLTKSCPRSSVPSTSRKSHDLKQKKKVVEKLKEEVEKKASNCQSLKMERKERAR